MCCERIMLVMQPRVASNLGEKELLLELETVTRGKEMVEKEIVK